MTPVLANSVTGPPGNYVTCDRWAPVQEVAQGGSHEMAFGGGLFGFPQRFLRLVPEALSGRLCAAIMTPKSNTGWPNQRL